MENDEKKELLVNDEHAESTSTSPSSYGTATTKDQAISPSPESGQAVKRSFLYKHKEKIPGYGVYRMIRGVKPYAHWVLLMMLLVYLINQLDRYTLPIVVTEVGYDLKYGDKICMVNRELNSTEMDEAKRLNLTRLCSVDNETSHYNNLVIK